jgi:GT2 family glycosyltransferase
MFSIIIVTFNSADVIAECIESVGRGHEVIVVDNASRDESAAIAEDLGATVIRNEENEGFGRACNRGAAIARGEAILFLNPDARLQSGALERLAAAMERYPDAAAFNPRLVDGNGREHFRGDNALIDNRMWFRGPATGDREIPMAVGAALLFRKSVFEQLGGFDENIFLFFEDDDLSARSVKAGYRLYHVHDSICVHLCEKSSAPSAELNEFKAYHFAKARIYVTAKHGLKQSLPLTALRYRAKLAFYRLTGNSRKASWVAARLRAVTDSIKAALG